MGAAVSWGGYFFVYEYFKKQWLSWKRHCAVAATTSSSQSSLLSSSLLPRPPFSPTSTIYNNNNNNNYDNNKNPTTTTTAAVVSLNTLDYFVLSCAAGIVMVIITNPIWLIKTRMQLQMTKASEQHHVQQRPYNSMWDAFRTIVRQEGPLALYRGSSAAFLLTSNGGIQFVVYETLRKYYRMDPKEQQQQQQKQSSLGIQQQQQQQQRRQQKRSLWDRFLTSLGFMTIGGTARVIASTITYPLQVAKSRIQQRAETLEFTQDGFIRVVQRQYQGGVWDTMKRIIQTEGITALFKGCIPNALRVAPNAALTFVVYEITMDLLQSSSFFSSS